jgi:hypothetical protein
MQRQGWRPATLDSAIFILIFVAHNLGVASWRVFFHTVQALSAEDEERDSEEEQRSPDGHDFSLLTLSGGEVGHLNVHAIIIPAQRHTLILYDCDCGDWLSTLPV